MKFIVLISICVIFFLNSCAPSSGETSYTEIKRITSPDSLVDAVLYQTNGGATTSFGYCVFVVRKGQQYSKEKTGELVFNADHVDSLFINWKEPKYLEVNYNHARIFEFTNFWQSKEIENYQYVVEIRLNPLTNGFSLSDNDRFVR